MAFDAHKYTKEQTKKYQDDWVRPWSLGAGVILAVCAEKGPL
jgi:hypothetical protein